MRALWTQLDSSLDTKEQACRTLTSSGRCKGLISYLIK
jgi:hypothetical protein